ncbi:MAG: hypothetical protein CMH36_01345 [Microbacterium sp.]|uniref:hypothetical protein n=1 Tax=uncultured Microbacterium sp. TaxID=191216 RepID=UPI000C8F091B|nr:hypothetical protein [Microbacterium sp.]
MDPQDKADAADALAKRLRLLIDAEIAATGTEPTYKDIAAFVESRGLSLGRARWSYMINGHRHVEEPEILAALADFFKVDPEFLTSAETGSLPPQVQAQLDLVRAMRKAKVKSYAARTLGDISPEALAAISRFLDEDAGRR